MPPKFLRAALVIAAVGGTYASFGRVSGQTAGTALLCVMVALKLVELRERRDVMVMLFLMYFLLITHFFFSQEIWTRSEERRAGKRCVHICSSRERQDP